MNQKMQKEDVRRKGNFTKDRKKLIFIFNLLINKKNVVHIFTHFLMCFGHGFLEIINTS